MAYLPSKSALLIRYTALYIAVRGSFPSPLCALELLVGRQIWKGISGCVSDRDELSMEQWIREVERSTSHPLSWSNEVRDITASLLSEACPGVYIMSCKRNGSVNNEYVKWSARLHTLVNTAEEWAVLWLQLSTRNSPQFNMQEEYPSEGSGHLHTVQV